MRSLTDNDRSTSLVLCGLLATITCPFAADAKPYGDVPFDAFPEFAPATLLPPIVAALKNELVDASLVRNLIICPPLKIRYDSASGRPTGWTIMIALEAKNSAGGYSGVHSYGAIFRQGKPVALADTGPLAGDGLDGMVARGIKNRMASCPSVPQSKLQELLEQSGRPMLQL